MKSTSKEESNDWRSKPLRLPLQIGERPPIVLRAPIVIAALFGQYF
jgi:hypothetical protein